jgi:hypothetical protein
MAQRINFISVHQHHISTTSSDNFPKRHEPADLCNGEGCVFLEVGT